MLTNFEKYSTEMKQFEESKIYKEKYAAVVHFLYLEINREPVFASRLAAKFEIKESQVRNIIKHARRSGHSIASGGRGYWIEKDYEKLMQNMEHLRERAMSELYTLSRMQALCQAEQLSLKFG